MKVWWRPRARPVINPAQRVAITLRRDPRPTERRPLFVCWTPYLRTASLMAAGGDVVVGKAPLGQYEVAPFDGYEPVPSVRRPILSGHADDAGVEPDALAEIKSARSPSGNIPMPTARLVAEVPSGQTHRPERLDDDVRLAGPYRCRPSPETGRRNSGCSPAPILPDLAP
jgi:hypothetical protein